MRRFHLLPALLLLSSGLCAQEHEALRAQLKSASLRERLEAAAELGKLGAKDATDDLLALLRDPSPQIRRAGVSALADLGVTAAAERIRGFLHSPDPDIRIATALALLSFDDREAMQDVLRLALEDEPHVRASVLWFLAPAAMDEAALALERMLDDDLPSFRVHALHGLWQLGATHAMPRIAPLLEDADEEVRQRAAVVLAALDPAAHAAGARAVLASLGAQGHGTPGDLALEVLAWQRDPVAWEALGLGEGKPCSPAALSLANVFAAPEACTRLRQIRFASHALRRVTLSEVIARIQREADVKVTLGESAPEALLGARFSVHVASLGARPDAFTLLSSLNERMLVDLPAEAFAWVATEEGVRLTGVAEATEHWRGFDPWKPAKPGG